MSLMPEAKQSYLQEQGGGSETPQQAKTPWSLGRWCSKQLLKTISKHRRSRWEQLARVYGREVTHTKQLWTMWDETRADVSTPSVVGLLISFPHPGLMWTDEAQDRDKRQTENWKLTCLAQRTLSGASQPGQPGARLQWWALRVNDI